MNSTLNPKQSDDPHDVIVVAPEAVRVAPSDEELSDLLHQAARHRSDGQAQIASDVPAGPKGPRVDTTFRAAAVNDNIRVRSESLVARAVRAFMALLLAACIGLAAFAWRAYGDTAEKKIAKWVTQYALTAPTAAPPPEKPASVAQQDAPAVRGADAANAAPPQAAPRAMGAAEVAASATAALPSGSPQLLQSMSRDLASLGQEVEQLKASVEQLKAGQQKMSDVAKTSDVKAPEQIVRPRIAALPPRSTAARARRSTAPSPPPQAAAVPPLPQVPAPYVPRQIETQRQPTAQPLADPELSSVPRPPMPVR